MPHLKDKKTRMPRINCWHSFPYAKSLLWEFQCKIFTMYQMSAWRCEPTEIPWKCKYTVVYCQFLFFMLNLSKNGRRSPNAYLHGVQNSVLKWFFEIRIYGGVAVYFLNIVHSRSRKLWVQFPFLINKRLYIIVDVNIPHFDSSRSFKTLFF